MNNLGEVIATREFNLKNGKLVVVSIGKPEKFPDSNDFYCPYQIVGIGNERVRRAGGIDAVQAMILTFRMIGADLVTSNEYRSGDLSWTGSANPQDIGFPLPDSLKD